EGRSLASHRGSWYARCFAPFLPSMGSKGGVAGRRPSATRQRPRLGTSPPPRVGNGGRAGRREPGRGVARGTPPTLPRPPSGAVGPGVPFEVMGLGQHSARCRLRIRPRAGGRNACITAKRRLNARLRGGSQTRVAAAAEVQTLFGQPQRRGTSLDPGGRSTMPNSAFLIESVVRRVNRHGRRADPE